MKKAILFSTICAAAFAAFAADWTISRLEAKINERKITGREMVVINGVTNTVTHYSQSGVTWSETNVARVVTGTLAPVRYSVLKLLTAIADTGKYAQVKTALQSATLPNGMPYWDALIAAQELREDDPRLQSGVALAVSAGLCTAEEAAALLKKAEE
jgi:hypothetical protein